MDDDKNKGIIKSTEEEEEIEEEETEEKDKKMSTTTESPPTAASSQENQNPENTAATTPRVTRNNKRLHQQQKNGTDSPKAGNNSINKTKSEEKADKIKRDLQTFFSSSSVLDAEKEKNDENSEPEVLGLENKKITDDDVSGSTISKNPKREREKTILEPRGEKAVPEKSSFLMKTRSSRLSNQPRGNTTSNISAAGAKQQSKNNESTENGKTVKTTTKKKKKSKPYTSYRRSKRLYDEAGALLSNGKDYCDCLETDCPGCHFPCKKCGSEKCGTECRCDRAWVYDEVKVEGTGIVVKNHAC